MRRIFFLAGFALLSFVFPVAVVAEPVSQSVISKVKALDVQGVHLGMTMDEIKQGLEKQGYAPGSDKKSRKSYLMQYTRKEEGAGGAAQTVTVRFSADRTGAIDAHPYFIEYFYTYRPPAVYTLWEDTRTGEDAQRIITLLCGKAGDQECRNLAESKTRLRIVLPQTKADFDGRLYNFEMDVMAGTYKVMVAVTGA